LQIVAGMKQQILIPNSRLRLEHGGALTYKKRKTKRAITIKKPMHLVLRSDKAKGPRSLLKNKSLVLKILRKYSRKFAVRVYQVAVCGNHIHCLVKGCNRKQLQHFFRVFSGQVAQEILTKHPEAKGEQKAFRGGTHRKNHKTFWSLLLYTRVVSWGRDYLNAKSYVIRNELEALGMIAYKRTKNRIAGETAKETANSA
jgi:REP element-mobilizing transposase RayT